MPAQIIEKVENNFNLGYRPTTRNWVVLDNGLRIILVPDYRLDLVSLYLRINTGSNFEGREMGSGVSHFLEHAVFLGSKEFPGKDEFSKFVEGLGAIDLNAYTTYDHTAFYFSVFRQHLAKTLKGFKDFIFNPTFQSDRVMEEKGTVLSEMDMYEDQVGDWFYHFVQSKLYQKIPFKFPVIGVRTIFDKLDEKSLEQYHCQHYQANNMVLSLVGNFDTETALEEVKKTFGVEKIVHKKIDGGTNKIMTPASIANSSSMPLAQECFIAEQGSESMQQFQTTHARVDFVRFQWIWKIPGYAVIGKDRYSLDIVTSLLAWNKGSILYNELKEKLEMVKNVSAYASVEETTGKVVLSFSLPKLKKDSSEELLIFLRECILEIKKNTVRILSQIEEYLDEKLLAGIKSSFLINYFNEQENNLEQAMTVAESLVDQGHLYQDQEYLEQVSSLDCEHIQELISKYLLRNNELANNYEFYLLPQSVCQGGKLFPDIETSDEYFSELKESVDRKDYQSVGWKEITDKPPREEDRSSESPIQKARTSLKRTADSSHSPNSFTGLLHRCDKRLPKCYLMLKFSGGSILESDDPAARIGVGSFNLFSDLLLTSNKKHRKLELYRLFREEGINYTSEVNDHSFGLSFSFLSSKFDKMLELLDSIINQQEFCEEDLNHEKKELIYQLEKSKESIDYLAGRHFRSNFFRGTRFAKPIDGDENDLEKITLDRLAVLKPLMSPQLASFYGSFQDRELNCLTEFLSNTSKILDDEGQKGFLSNNAREIIQSHRNELDFEDLEFKDIIKIREVNCKQSIFHMGFRLPPLKIQPPLGDLGHLVLPGEKERRDDEAALEVLQSYLSGLGGPLFKMRSENFKKDGKSLGGRAYRLGVQYRLSPFYGSYTFSVNFRKDARMEYQWAIDSITKLLNSLKETLIPIIELDQAKNTLLAKNLNNSMRLSYQVRQESYYEMLGMGFATLEGYHKRINRVTVQDIQRVVRNYFGDNFLAQVVLPEE